MSTLFVKLPNTSLNKKKNGGRSSDYDLNLIIYHAKQFIDKNNKFSICLSSFKHPDIDTIFPTKLFKIDTKTKSNYTIWHYQTVEIKLFLVLILDKKEGLNVRPVLKFKNHHVGTIATFRMLNIGTQISYFRCIA